MTSDKLFFYTKFETFIDTIILNYSLKSRLKVAPFGLDAGTPMLDCPISNNALNVGLTLIICPIAIA